MRRGGRLGLRSRSPRAGARGFDGSPVSAGLERNRGAEQDCPPGLRSLEAACASRPIPPLVSHAGSRGTGTPSRVLEPMTVSERPIFLGPITRSLSLGQPARHPLVNASPGTYIPGLPRSPPVPVEGVAGRRHELVHHEGSRQRSPDVREVQDRQAPRRRVRGLRGPAPQATAGVTGARRGPGWRVSTADRTTAAGPGVGWRGSRSHHRSVFASARVGLERNKQCRV